MSSGFNFGVGGGVPFGTPNTQTTQAGSVFNTNPAAATTQPTTAGFSFGSSGFGGNVPSSGFSFPGANTATTTAAPTTTTAGGVLSFGINPSSLNATKPSGLGFGGAAGASAAGFSLAALPTVTTSVTTTTAPMFGFSGGLGGAAMTTTTGSQQLAFGGGIAQSLGGLGALGATTNSAAAQPSLGGFKLGGGPVSATTTTAATSLLGGLLAGSKPAATSAGALGGTGFSFATPSTQPASTTTASTGFSIGGMNSLSSGPTTAATTASSSLAPAVGFGLTSGSLPAATSTAVNSGFSLTFSGNTVSVPAPTSVAQAAATTTSAGGTVPTAPCMNYRQLEEAINKWTQELEEQEAVFLDQATQVNAWDRLLIENGDMITQLNGDVEKVKTDQQRLDQELDFILGQQSELEDMLKPLELALEQLPPITFQQHADLEREHTYKLAENVDSQLKRMASDLKEIVEHLNSGTSAQDNNDPLIQISRILNAHVDSLQWIDQKTGVLQRRVEDVSRQANVQRKQQQTYR